MKAFFIFLICFFAKAHAQSTLRVTSFDSRLPLVYASIVNRTKHLLVFTDEQGNAAGNFATGDSIIISYVGYQTLEAIIVTGNEQYQLRQKQDLLKPVIIEHCKSRVYSEYSNLDADTGRKFGGVMWDKAAMNGKVSVLLRPVVTQGQLKAFSIWLKEEKRLGAPKISIETPIKLSFYNIDDSSGLPGELVSNRQIIYYPKKEGKQSIGLDSIHLGIPIAGMYVCIEYIMDEKYRWPLKIFDPETGYHRIQLRYGADLDGVYSKDFNLAFYNYEEGLWFFPGHMNKSALNNIHGTIKCSAEIISCKDQ